MSLTIRASRSDSPEITSSIPCLLGVVERDVVALQRHRRAVDRGERRPQLVRDGRDEVALQLLDRPLVGEVAERVDGAVRELGGGEREPELAARAVDRERLRPVAGLAERPAAPAPASAGAPTISASREARDALRRRVPEPDDAVAVDEEDAVADELERLRRLRAAAAARRRGAHCRARRRRGRRAPERARGRSLVKRPASRAPSVSTPSVSPRATIGTSIIERRADRVECPRSSADLLERLE